MRMCTMFTLKPRPIYNVTENSDEYTGPLAAGLEELALSVGVRSNAGLTVHLE